MLIGCDFIINGVIGSLYIVDVFLIVIDVFMFKDRGIGNMKEKGYFLKEYKL